MTTATPRGCSRKDARRVTLLTQGEQNVSPAAPSVWQLAGCPALRSPINMLNERVTANIN